MGRIATLLSDLHHEDTHPAGLVSFETIDAIERVCDGATINRSMETGCGLTTVALSNLSAHHVVFALDDRDNEASSVAFAMNSPAYRAEVRHHVFGLLPGFPEEGMKRQVVSFDVTEDDVARTNILVFKPAATWAVESFRNKRQYGIAINNLRYRLAPSALRGLSPHGRD